MLPVGGRQTTSAGVGPSGFEVELQFKGTMARQKPIWCTREISQW
jgi:hypothetical protein